MTITQSSSLSMYTFLLFSTYFSCKSRKRQSDDVTIGSTFEQRLRSDKRKHCLWISAVVDGKDARLFIASVKWLSSPVVPHGEAHSLLLEMQWRQCRDSSTATTCHMTLRRSCLIFCAAVCGGDGERRNAWRVAGERCRTGWWES